MATPKAVLWLRRRFITGFFVTVPLIISVVALVWIFGIIDDLTGPVYDRVLGRHLAGLGVVTTALFVLLVGVIASNVIGKRLLSRGEGYLARSPSSAPSMRPSSSCWRRSRPTTIRGSSAW